MIKSRLPILFMHDIHIGYFRYATCRFADEVEPWIQFYQSYFDFYTWTQRYDEPFPSPTLLIETGEMAWLYSGVNQIKNAFQTHPFFQLNHSYLP